LFEKTRDETLKQEWSLKSDSVRSSIKQSAGPRPSVSHSKVETGNLETMKQDFYFLSVLTQNFIDEHVNDKVRLVRSSYKPIEEKMEVLEWLCRYTELVSYEQVLKLVQSYREWFLCSERR